MKKNLYNTKKLYQYTHSIANYDWENKRKNYLTKELKLMTL